MDSRASLRKTNYTRKSVNWNMKYADTKEHFHEKSIRNQQF